jgi:radical SAM protein with 4Fe4S-binding SPASM domain
MWCSVLSDKVVPYLSDFVAMAISNSVQQINFNELEYYGASSHELKSIFDLRGEEFISAVDEIEKMDLLAKNYGVEITYAFNSFLDVVRERKTQELASSRDDAHDRFNDVCRISVKGIQGDSSHLVLRSKSLSLNENKGLTRLCLSPWNTAYVLSDGTVCTCCVRGESMGKISSDVSFDDILNNNEYREFRWRLLTGNINDNACLACPVMPVVSVEQLQYTVDNLLNKR